MQYRLSATLSALLSLAVAAPVATTAGCSRCSTILDAGGRRAIADVKRLHDANRDDSFWRVTACRTVSDIGPLSVYEVDLVSKNRHGNSRLMFYYKDGTLINDLNTEAIGKRSYVTSGVLHRPGLLPLRLDSWYHRIASLSLGEWVLATDASQAAREYLISIITQYWDDFGAFQRLSTSYDLCNSTAYARKYITEPLLLPTQIRGYNIGSSYLDDVYPIGDWRLSGWWVVSQRVVFFGQHDEEYFVRLCIAVHFAPDNTMDDVQLVGISPDTSW